MFLMAIVGHVQLLSDLPRIMKVLPSSPLNDGIMNHLNRSIVTLRPGCLIGNTKYYIFLPPTMRRLGFVGFKHTK